MKRRTLLTLTATAAAGGAALALRYLFQSASRAGAQNSAAARRANFPPLPPDPAGLLDLAAGYSYQIVGRALDPLHDGFRAPCRPDGMGCFVGADGTWVLMRNHEEDRDPASGALPWGKPPPPEVYDPRFHGGVTRLVLEPRSLQVIHSNLALTGTARNCAGGVSPWGWLSCEESQEVDHGFVFLCDQNATELTKYRRVDGYGRCNHEAVCVDPATHVAYLTEDQPDSCLYRFMPTHPDRPFEGKLQALREKTEARREFGLLGRHGSRFDVEWVDIEDPSARWHPLRLQAQELGAAVFRRGEGIWFDQDRAYFTCTTGGPSERGQVFELSTSDQLTLLAVGTETSELDMPDNLTVAPDGTLFLAEDNARGHNHIRTLSPDGTLRTLARNVRGTGEFAGLCFSPDGTVLFANLQLDGLTLAISGPFAG